MIVGHGDIASVLPDKKNRLFFASGVKDEFLHWIGMIPDWSCEMNITVRRMKIKEIVDEYCLIGLHTK